MNEKELLKILKKAGLKAGDIKPVSKKKVKATPVATVDKEVVADLAKTMAKQFVKELAKKDKLSDKDKKDLTDNIKTKVFTNYHGLKEIDYPSDLGSLSGDEKIVNFFKALVYQKSDPQAQVVLRALVEGTDSEGGYLVPEELKSEVWRILPDIAIMRRVARTIPMSTDTLKLNNLAARPSAYWTGEYASKSTTSAEFGQVTLSPNDLVCLLPISDQLLADANINLVQFIIELFAEAIGAAEDKAFFTGTGTGQPRGINQESLKSVAAGGALSFDNIIGVIDQVPQRVGQSPSTAFIGSRYVKTILRQLKDNNNNYIWRDAGPNPGAGAESARLPDTIYGYPFHEQNDIAQSELYFGDWRNYIIGDRQAISVRTTTEGGDAWRRNAMEIKAVERVDGRAVIVSPFAKITGI